ncbi:hypothetical protein PN481_11695 [Nodularia spumigena CS-588/06]|uniref:hypothetical protein n=1 Tax=Nodularia spumigena TaxID=70799 RepID=UPI00232F2259|nr:hypothetical protein [Nodularia spumigena]MDB9344168.1 hypothetical protein [Nodularia spumigena CS-588/06]
MTNRHLRKLNMRHLKTLVGIIHELSLHLMLPEVYRTYAIGTGDACGGLRLR